MERFLSELGAPWTDVATVVVAGVSIYLATIVWSRIVGLRSFAKMASFDFAMTVAVGSLIAAVTLANVSLVNGLVGLSVLFLAQYTVARLRQRTALQGAVDNEPLLLMYGTQVLQEHLQEARISDDDLRAKLREANVRRLDQVQAVVLETTGDVSVLQGDGPLDPALFHGVRGAERVGDA